MYTWSVANITARPDGFIDSANTICSYSDDAGFSYSIPLFEKFSGSITIPYQDVTENEVLGWVFAQINKESYEAMAFEMAMQNPPLKKQPLPWNVV